MTYPKEGLEYLILVCKAVRPTILKRIKVTTNFYNYLSAKCQSELILEKNEDTPRGYISQWTGIPIEIDDTIENEYYELVYKETTNVETQEKENRLRNA